MPNSWTEPTWQSTGNSEEVGHLYGPGSGQSPGFSYIALDGEMKTNPVNPEEGCCTVKNTCLCCCPCFVDPCSEERKKEWKHAMLSFTFVISVVQVIMLIVALSMGGVISLKINPMIGPGADTLAKLGAKDAALIQKGHVWRLITPVFLHAGILHALLNLFSQLRFGMHLERKWGILKYIGVYTLSTVGASILSCLWRPNNSGVGASGAICGLFGAHIAEIIITKHRTHRATFLINISQAAIFVIIFLALGAAPLVDTPAHFGGLITGFFTGLAVLSPEAKNGFQKRVCLIVGTVVTSLWFLITFLCFWLVIKIN